MMHALRNKRYAFVLLGLCLLLHMAAPSRAMAQPAPAAATSNCSYTSGNDICTNFECLKQTVNDGKPGILTNITNTIKAVVGDASEKLFKAFTGSSKYQSAVGAAMALMIIIYGISFMIGVVQPSYGQILIRLLKMGVIFTLISPAGWSFFSDIVVKFFNDGTDELIRGVISIGTGTTIPAGGSPFLQLDGLAKWVLSPDMIIALLSLTFASGPYGLAVGGLMAFAVGGVLKLLLEALKIYGVAFVMRALLLGTAPIFLVFLLFERTKGLFTGWLNSLINLSIQPILYFTFISFFFIMIQTAAIDMLSYNGTNANGKSIEFCWAETTRASGTTNKASFWKVKFPGDTAPVSENFTWNGLMSCMLGTDPKACEKSFPINIIDILSFLILIYIAQQFSTVIQRLSSEISNAMVNLDTQSKFDFGQAQATQATGGGGTPPSNQQASKASPQTTQRTGVPGDKKP